MLGLAVILMVFLTAGFCAAELLRGFRLWKMALVLHRADVTGRSEERRVGKECSR